MECVFKDIYGCGNSEKELTRAGVDRISRILTSSTLRQDNIHNEIEKNKQPDETITIFCHRDCVSTYTSSWHIKQHLKRRGTSNTSSDIPAKRTRQSIEGKFEFRDDCLYCGEYCDLKPDPKNPKRWRKALMCRTTDRPGRQSFKDAILETCTIRNDEWAKQVQARLLSVVSDLHAADARYHDDCRKRFMKQQINKVSSCKTSTDSVDKAFDATIQEMKEDKNQVWTSVGLHGSYTANGGNFLSRNALVNRLSEVFGDDMLVFSSPGLANIIVFRNRATDLLRLERLEDDNVHIENVAKQVVKECKSLLKKQILYNLQIDKEIALEESSPTLLTLLSSLSEKLNNTLPALLIANMVTAVISHKPTSLQIALGIHTRERNKIDSLHDFGVTCSYDEVKIFKASAATAASNTKIARPIRDSKEGLIQAVADNFDANISSQNCIRSTHALALLLTQNKTNADIVDQRRDTITRIKKEDMKKQVIPSVPICYYKGPKKPDMPLQRALYSILPLKILAEQVVTRERAKDLDFEFLKAVTAIPETPEFGGFNTSIARRQGQSMKPETTAMYTPLIDMIPSDPGTMMTAMFEAQKLTAKCGQNFTVFTADQQLYRVMVNVLWVHPEIFPNLYPRLGGMHMLMSFVGCVGTLMDNSGLEEVMKAAFGGVTRMLSGKTFPQNVRALRIVSETVIEGVIKDVENFNELITVLEEKARHSRTTKLWLECLIKPVFIMMMFVRAEREGDWSLHLASVADMMPYFFAAKHINYARYGLYYLRSMQSLPDEIQSRFRKGEHVMRHKAGLWNGIWSDMYIETTFMRYGHGPGGIVGITLSESALKRWALSLHTCSRLLQDLNNMREHIGLDNVTSHKEEAAARITADSNDRNNVRMKLETCVHPLNPEEHSDSLMNIVTGRIVPDTVNVDRAVGIGRVQMVEYESTWPEGFNGPITNKVVTMSVSKKSVKLGSNALFDTQLIYARVMGLASTRKIDLKDVFSHELAPIPTSMFDDNGDMRIATNKSMLKKKLQVAYSARIAVKPDVFVIDGCAILWNVHWPSNGTVLNFMENFWHYVYKRLIVCNVFLVFDKYHEYSIKSSTRKSRGSQKTAIGYKLNAATPLPAQHKVLTNIDNKVQLIDMICEHLKGKASNMYPTVNNKQTGSSDIPTEVHMGIAIDREDLKTSHEEADVIMPQQVIYAASQGAACVTVICDDTDVFVLLLHFYHLEKLTCTLLMEGTCANRTVIDIEATCREHSHIIPQLLAAHALSGCDTVAKLSGLGKATVVKQMQRGCDLKLLGDESADMNSLNKMATRFIAACYGKQTVESMSSVRYDVWSSKMGKKSVRKMPKLQSLPPTTESFNENVKRAHIQACIWRSALDPHPPSMDPVNFGWSKDVDSKILLPVALPEDKPPAPECVLKLICCGCSSDQPCATSRCGCYTAKLACTIFCNCSQMSNCKNKLTKEIDDLSNVTDDESNDSDSDIDDN